MPRSPAPAARSRRAAAGVRLMTYRPPHNAAQHHSSGAACRKSGRNPASRREPADDTKTRLLSGGSEMSWPQRGALNTNCSKRRMTLSSLLMVAGARCFPQPRPTADIRHGGCPSAPRRQRRSSGALRVRRAASTTAAGRCPAVNRARSGWFSVMRHRATDCLISHIIRHNSSSRLSTCEANAYHTVLSVLSSGDTRRRFKVAQIMS